MLNSKLLSASAAATVSSYVENVFSTYLYNGTGSTQTITNEINLSGKGGMVWIKGRSETTGHRLTNTTTGATKSLESNSTAAETTESTGLTAFNANGFTIGADADYNTNGAIYTSWTFRKQAKFFDVVTYTGTGANRTVSHSLGSVPGCIIVKRTDTTGDWQVYHRSLANTEYLVLNDTAAKATGATRWNSTTPTSTVFSLGTDATVNASGGTYVAYLFAHDAGGFGAAGTDNVISCGSVTSDANRDVSVTLGFEPQWVLFKRTNNLGAWMIADSMRGFLAATTGTDQPPTPILCANLADIEFGADAMGVTATGFKEGRLGTAGDTYIYISIRRGPMETPTDATKVFMPTVYTGTNVDNRLVNTTIAPDMVWMRQRDSTTVAGMVSGDRLRGQPYSLTGSTDAELDNANSFDQQLVVGVEYGTAFSSMNGVWVGNDATSQLNASTTANNQIVEAFKRAPGFFDVVCYTGTGANQNVDHNLAVIPEFIIVRARDAAQDWYTVSKISGTTYAYFDLNSTGGGINLTVTATTTTFNPREWAPNTSNVSYVAYLFASCSGVSKVGTYTGNGSSQTINCGFTNGVRFVLIRRTGSTGDCYLFDSARGITAGSDPFLLLNSTAAEVTTGDAIDPDSSGFIVNNDATNFPINVSSATYIFLAIA